MVKRFKRARDRIGEYQVDWSIFQDCAGAEPPATIEFIPFSKGDARVPSIPADETMYCGVGHTDRLTHAAMSPERLRQFAACLAQTADIIDAQAAGARQ